MKMLIVYDCRVFLVPRSKTMQNHIEIMSKRIFGTRSLPNPTKSRNLDISIRTQKAPVEGEPLLNNLEDSLGFVVVLPLVSFGFPVACL